jgi:hypothetical protein
VIEHVIRLYGFHGEFNNAKTVLHWESLAAESGIGWMKVTKYKLAAFFAYHTQNQLPPKPFKKGDHPGKLLGGRAGLFIDLLLKRASPEERWSFLTSIQQSKKGMPRDFSKKTLTSKEEDFVRHITITTPPPQPHQNILRKWSEYEDYESVEVLLNKTSVEQQLKRTVKELFKRSTFTVADRVKAFFPSTSANYINTRGQGGAIGVLLQDKEILTGLRTPGGAITTDTYKGEEQIQSGNFELHEEAFQQRFQNLWLRILSRAAQEEPQVKPVALAEPLKYRIITKGPPFQQTVLRPLWKRMHSTLREHPCFTLIGRPVDDTYMYNRLGRHLGEGEKYLSGDYEAATDNIESWASNAVANAIADELKLYPVERRLLLQSLTGHLLGEKKQGIGQLMGSVTSFPILCIINASLSRWALELDSKKKISLQRARLMINGDDIAMVCTSVGYDHWKRLTKFVGLKESIGKTYFSKEFVQINSTNFRKTEVGQPHIVAGRRIQNVRLTLVPYINMGLLLGLKRSGGQISLTDSLTDEYDNIGTRYRESIRLCPRRLQETVHKFFIEQNRSTLEKVKLPWYIPEWIGGLGLLGFKRPSDLDLRIAQQILYNWKKTRPIQIRNKMKWYMWNLAEKRFKGKVFEQNQKTQGTEIYNRAISHLVVDLIFDSEVDLSSLLKDEPSHVLSAIRKNEKLWNPKRYPKLPPPIAVEQLDFQAKYPSVLEDAVPNPEPNPFLILD